MNRRITIVLAAMFWAILVLVLVTAYPSGWSLLTLFTLPLLIAGVIYYESYRPR